jgi:hypothetical protein
MPVRLLCAALCAGLLLVPAAAPAASSPSGDAPALAKKKAKKKKCKKKRVRVKVAGRTRCVPIGRALPKPKAIDPRLAIVRAGLTPAIGHVPDPKNKVPPPAEKLYRQFDPQALKGMEKAVAMAIPRLDTLALKRRPLARAGASEESGNSFSTTIGGVKIDGRLSIAIDAVGQLVGTAEITQTRDQGGGRTISVTTRMPIRLSHQGFETKGGSCPTADGKVDAVDSVGITVQTEFRSDNGKTLDEYFIYEVADESDPLQGMVGDDAKLDTLEIKSIEDVTEKAGGSIFGGSIVHGSIVRNTVVDMRTGAYDPHVTLVNVGVTLAGVLNVLSPLIRSQVAERLKAAADKGFAATVKYEIDRFRELEAIWREPNRCARLSFGRANESLTLAAGEGGDESVRLDATRGGSPSQADWTLPAQENGEFSFADHSSNPTRFSYRATRAGKGVKVRATVRAVSKAGIAEQSWVQKTKEEEGIQTIEGSFGGELSGATVIGPPSAQKWSGVVSLHRLTPPDGGPSSGLFAVTSGNVSVDLSGTESSGATGCLQAGSAQAPIAGGTMTVSGPGGGVPYQYDIQLSMPFLAVKATRHTCPKAAQEAGWEGTEFDAAPAWKLNVSGQESGDGLGFAGSVKESFGAPPFVSSIEESWNLHGKP